jgi:hypothetical protein
MSNWAKWFALVGLSGMDGYCCFGGFEMITFVDMGISAEVLPELGHLIELKRNMNTPIISKLGGAHWIPVHAKLPT